MSLHWQTTLNQSSPLTRARLLAATADLSAHFLTRGLDTDLDKDEVFLNAIKLRLNLPPSNTMPTHCHCGSDLSTDPWHILSHSAGQADSIWRHDSIRDAISAVAQLAGGRCWKEPRFQIQHRDDCHTDLRVALGSELFYIDVAVVHPTSSSYLNRSCTSRLAAARAQVAIKQAKYDALCEAENATFIPFVVETFGGFCKEAKAFVNKLARHAELASNVWSSTEIRNRAITQVQSQLFLGNLRLANTELSKSFRAPPLRSRINFSTPSRAQAPNFSPLPVTAPASERVASNRGRRRPFDNQPREFSQSTRTHRHSSTPPLPRSTIHCHGQESRSRSHSSISYNQRPRNNNRRTTSRNQRPRNPIHRTRSDNRRQRSHNQRPRSSNHPRNRNRRSRSSNQRPSSHNRRPSNNNRSPGNEHGRSRSRNQRSRSSNQSPGSSNQGSGITAQLSSNGNQAPRDNHQRSRIGQDRPPTRLNIHSWSPRTSHNPVRAHSASPEPEGQDAP